MSTKSQRICAWQKTESGKASLKKKHQKIKIAAVKKLGGKCSNPSCKWVNEDGTLGCTDERCLQVDHPKGGGHKEERKIGTHGIYRRILKGHDKEYQLLCANCNWIKRVSNNEWPLK